MWLQPRGVAVLLVVLSLLSVAAAQVVHPPQHAPSSGYVLHCEDCRPPPSTVTSWTWHFPLRNLHWLKAQHRDISDPAHAAYRQFLSSEQIDAMTDPDFQRTVAPVLDYLSSHGLPATNATLIGSELRVVSTVAVIESAFGVTMQTYRAVKPSRSRPGLVARSANATIIPQALAEAVWFLSGVNDLQPQAVRQERAAPRLEPSVSVPASGSASPAVNGSQTRKLLSTDGALQCPGRDQYFTSPVFVAQQALFSPPTTTQLAEVRLGVVSNGDWYDPQDLADFASDLSYSLPPTLEGEFTDQYYYDQEGASVQATVDTSAAYAYCPQCTVYLFPGEIPAVYTDVYNSFSAARPHVVSVAYTSAEDELSSAQIDAQDSQFMKLGAIGVTVVVNSGDNGANGGSEYCDLPTFMPYYPASSPYVLTVGATDFLGGINDLSQYYQTADGTASKLCGLCPDGVTETFCQTGAAAPEQAVGYNPGQGGSYSSKFASGGGFSNYEPQPDWQAAFVDDYLNTCYASDTPCELPYSTKYNSGNRAYPDVAMFGGTWPIGFGGYIYLVEGTSLSAPSFAAVVASLVQISLLQDGAGLGFINPLLYSFVPEQPGTELDTTPAFNDIQFGENVCSDFACDGYNCQGWYAIPGWDPVTGLGSPIVPVLQQMTSLAIVTLAAQYSPSNLAVDRHNNLIISNTAGNSVLLQSDTGVLLQQVSGLLGPAGADADTTGNIWVADIYNSQVVLFEASTGAVLTSISGFFGPRDVAVLFSGNSWEADQILVADTENNRILWLLADGMVNAAFDGFNNPSSICIDNEGYMYVAESYSNQVVKASAVTGEVVQTFTGGLSNPAAVAVDGLFNVYVSDYANSRVVVFAPAGYVLEYFELSGNPVGIAIDHGGNLYVAIGDHVEKFSLGQLSDGVVLYDIPYDVAVDSSQVLPGLYVADSLNNRVLVTSDDGTFLRVLLQNFVNPLGLCIDADGNVLVADSGNNRIVKMSKQGTFLQQYTTGFNLPFDVAVDGLSSSLYVADGLNNRIVVLSADGAVTLTIPGFSLPTSLAFGSTINDNTGLPNMYVADQRNQRVVCLDINGNVLAVYNQQNSGVVWSYPSGVALDRADNLYVSSNANNQLVVLLVAQGNSPLYIYNSQLNGPFGIGLDSSANVYVANTFDSNVVTMPAIFPYGDMYGIAVDDMGYVYAADNNNARILQFLQNTDFHKPAVDFLTGIYMDEFSYPSGLACDGSSLYVADSLNNRVVQLSTITGFVNRSFEAGFDSPFGVALDSKHDLYVTDTRNQRILKLDHVTGNVLQTLTTSNSISPIGIAVDAAFKVYVADELNSQIIVWDKAGAVSRTYSANFSGCSGVALDKQANVYVADRFHNRVVVLTPAGATIGVYTGLTGPYSVAVNQRNGDVYVANTLSANVVALPPINVQFKASSSSSSAAVRHSSSNSSPAAARHSSSTSSSAPRHSSSTSSPAAVRHSSSSSSSFKPAPTSAARHSSSTSSPRHNSSSTSSTAGAQHSTLTSSSSKKAKQTTSSQHSSSSSSVAAAKLRGKSSSSSVPAAERVSSSTSVRKGAKYVTSSSSAIGKKK